MSLSILQSWNWTLILLGIAALANLALAYTAFRVIREARATQLHAREEADALRHQTVLVHRPLFVLDRVFRFSYWEEVPDAEQGISIVLRNVRPHPALGLTYRLKFFLVDHDHVSDLFRESTGTLQQPVVEGQALHLHTPKHPCFGMPGLHYLGVELEYRDPLAPQPFHQDFTVYLCLKTGETEIAFEPLCDLLLADQLRELRMAGTAV